MNAKTPVSGPLSEAELGQLSDFLAGLHSPDAGLGITIPLVAGEIDPEWPREALTTELHRRIPIWKAK